MDFKRLRSRVKLAILMTDVDGWKDGKYPDDGEARKYANVAVDIIEEMCASQNTSTSNESLPIKCQCKRSQFTRTVDINFNPLCGKCGKAI